MPLREGNNYIAVTTSQRFALPRHTPLEHFAEQVRFISAFTVVKRVPFDAWVEAKVVYHGILALTPLEVGFKDVRYFKGHFLDAQNLCEDRILLKKVLYGSVPMYEDSPDHCAIKHLLKRFATRHHDPILNAYVKKGAM